MRASWYVKTREYTASGSATDGRRAHESTGSPDTGETSLSSCHSSSSGVARSREPNQTTESFAKMEPHDSTCCCGWGLEGAAVSLWKRSMLRAHRLKVKTPRDVT